MALTRTQVQAVLEHKSIAAVRSWLKRLRLAHSARTRAELIERVFRLLSEQQLTEEQFRHGLLSLEEASGKRVLLFDIECPENPSEHFLHSLQRQRISLSDGIKLAPHLPRSSTLAYVTKQIKNVAGHRNTLARAKWAETHESVEPDIERNRFVRKRMTKVIVMVADLEAKTAQLRFDKPEAIHPHKDADGNSNDDLFYRDYIVAASTLLGMTLSSIDVRSSLRSLAETAPRVIRLESKDFRTRSNSRVKFSSKTDVRDDGDWQVMHSEGGDAWAYDREFLHWLPATSHGKLSREVFTAIDGKTGKLRVEADCHEEELEYAISTIRAHKG